MTIRLDMLDLEEQVEVTLSDSPSLVKSIQDLVASADSAYFAEERRAELITYQQQFDPEGPLADINLPRKYRSLSPVRSLQAWFNKNSTNESGDSYIFSVQESKTVYSISLTEDEVSSIRSKLLTYFQPIL